MSLSQDASDNTKIEVREGQLSSAPTTRLDQQGVLVDSPASFAISAAAGNGSAVGTLTADAGSKTFSIIEGNAVIFTVNSTTGAITILNNATLAAGSHVLVIKVVAADGFVDFCRVVVTVTA